MDSSSLTNHDQPQLNQSHKYQDFAKLLDSHCLTTGVMDPTVLQMLSSLNSEVSNSQPSCVITDFQKLLQEAQLLASIYNTTSNTLSEDLENESYVNTKDLCNKECLIKPQQTSQSSSKSSLSWIESTLSESDPLIMERIKTDLSTPFIVNKVDAVLDSEEFLEDLNQLNRRCVLRLIIYFVIKLNTMNFL